MTKKLKRFDVADYLDSEETIAEYLNAILEDNDPALLLAAIGDVAKARGMQQIAQDSGLDRDGLYESLAPDAQPKFETVMKVLKGLGVQLTMSPAKVV